MKKALLAVSMSMFVLVSNGFAAMTVHFVDVGQGDAIYIVLPSSKTVLIDGGASNAKISKFLKAHKVKQIDYVVLTHPHTDHYAGLKYVFDKCQVRYFYDTRMNNTGAKSDETIRQKAKKEPGCKTYYPAAGDTLEWDPEVKVEVLNACPGKASASDGTAVNCSSIVLRLTYKGESVLLTGDIDTEVESSLVSDYADRLSSTVLKVAHHGSEYGSSNTFLEKVKPKYAYISVGKNTYGHPNDDAIERIEGCGATVYRTDQDGTLTYVIP